MKNKIDINKLPTEFYAVSWDAHWEFERPLVIYSPKEYAYFKSVGSAHEIENIIEDLCIDICEGFYNDGGLKKEIKWRKWNLENMKNKKNATHIKVKVEWFENDDGNISFKFLEIKFLCNEK
jgi:hypothetical protein